MIIKPHSSKIIIVLIGDFNPLIFKPTWFAKTGVIGEDEAENAEIEVIHSEIVRFKLSWMALSVDKHRFSFEITQPPDIRALDFVLKTFGELLSHTPIGAMGLNLRVEFDSGSYESRNNIGHALAPKSAWGEWSKDLDKTEGKYSGGMMSITMRQHVVEDRDKGFIQTRVEPSDISESMVFVEVNDHYAVKDADNFEGSYEIMEYLNKNFHASIKRANWIVEQVMRLC